MDSYYTEGPPKQEDESQDAEKDSGATQNASRNTVNSGQKTAAPKTGDESDAVLWMGILMVASLGLLYKEKLSEDLLQV